jgi:hypothetical protein
MFHIDICSDHASLRGPLVMVVSRGNKSHSLLEHTAPEHASGRAETLNRALLPRPPVGCREEFSTLAKRASPLQLLVAC